MEQASKPTRQAFADIDAHDVVTITDEHGALVAAMSLETFRALQKQS